MVDKVGVNPSSLPDKSNGVEEAHGTGERLVLAETQRELEGREDGGEGLH